MARRRLALDRNPLRRRPDRVRVWVTVAAAALIAVAIPLTARTVMNQVHHSAVRQASEQAAHRHRVPAVLLRDARPQSWTSPAAEAEPGAPTRPVASVPARWRGPDGRQHRANVAVHDRVRAGQTVPIWVDARGSVTTAPPTAEQIGVRTSFAGAVTGLAVLALIGGTTWLLRRLLARRSAAEWDRQWAAIAPQWTRKY